MPCRDSGHDTCVNHAEVFDSSDKEVGSYDAKRVVRLGHLENWIRDAGLRLSGMNVLCKCQLDGTEFRYSPV